MLNCNYKQLELALLYILSHYYISMLTVSYGRSLRVPVREMEYKHAQLKLWSDTIKNYSWLMHEYIMPWLNCLRHGCIVLKDCYSTTKPKKIAISKIAWSFCLRDRWATNARFNNNKCCGPGKIATWTYIYLYVHTIAF